MVASQSGRFRTSAAASASPVDSAPMPPAAASRALARICARSALPIFDWLTMITRFLHLDLPPRQPERQSECRGAVFSYLNIEQSLGAVATRRDPPPARHPRLSPRIRMLPE